MSQTITITIEVPDGVTVAVATAPPVMDTPALVVERPADQGERSKVGTTEQLLLDALAATHGRIADPKGGRATTQLIDRAGCESVAAAKQALVRLAERGLIEREITAKRCYRISLTADGWNVARRR